LSGLAIAMAFSFIIFFNTFIFNFIIISFFFFVYVLMNLKKKILRDIFLWKGLAICIVLFTLLISVKLLPTGDLMSRSGEGRFSQVLSDSPSASRTRGMDVKEILNTFMGRKKAVLTTKFGPGKIISILTFFGLLQYFNRNNRKDLLFLLLCSSGLMIIAILIISKTQLYYLMRSIIPYFNRVTLMPTSLLLLIVAISILSALGTDVSLDAFRKIMVRFKIISRRISPEQLFYTTGCIVAFAVTLWNIRFMNIPTYNYNEIPKDIPHLSEVTILKKKPEGRIAFFGMSYVYGQDQSQLDYGIESYNCDYGRFTVKESYVVQNMNLETGYDRFLSLAGVEYIISLFKLEKYKTIKSKYWINWEGHFGELNSRLYTTKGISKGYRGKLVKIKNKKWKKRVYIHEPIFPARDRYRIYTDAVLLVGAPENTGKYALKLMNNKNIDPFKTLIIETNEENFDKLESGLWKYIQLVGLTDINNRKDYFSQTIPKEIPIIKMYNVDINKVKFEAGSSTYDIPDIRTTNSYITIDTSNIPKGILFVGNTYYNGWKLFGKKEKKIPEYKANYAFQGYLILKPGKYNIIFRPGIAFIGMLLSVVGTAIIILISHYEANSNIDKNKKCSRKQ